jgi:hypothetical protein
MSYLGEQERATRTAPILLDIIERPAAFSELFARYREADGLIDDDFLQRLPRARDLWRRANEAEAATEILRLPLAFREAVLHGLFRDRCADTLQKYLDLAADRAVKKSLKRLLYELRKAGVDPPRMKRGIFRPMRAEEESPLPCLVIGPDAAGERVTVILAASPAGVHVLNVSDSGDAIIEFDYDVQSRRSVRRYLDIVRGANNLPLVKIDFLFAWYTISRVAEVARDHDRDFPRGFLRAFGELPPPSPQPTHHPYRDLVDTEIVFDALSRLDQSDLLLDEAELNLWSVDDATLKTLDTSLGTLDSAALTISKQQHVEQIAHRLARAADDFFGPPLRRVVWAERLRDAAYLLARRGAVGQAATAAAVALRLENATVAPSSIPLFLEIVARALDWPEQTEDSPPPEKKSPGGLILP